MDSSDTSNIISAIDIVLESYFSDMDDISEQQVLIQHQAVDVAYCGVLFTYDIQDKDHIILLIMMTPVPQI